MMPSLDHVGYWVDDLGSALTRWSQDLGVLINTARSGPISVAWHDGGPLFPHPIELHQHNTSSPACTTA